MSRLFHALPTADAILVRLLPTRSSFSPDPAPAEFSACLPCGPTDAVSRLEPEPALRLPLSSAPARCQLWALWTSACIPRLDSDSRLEQDRVKLDRNGCMLPSAVRLSLSRYCTHQLHPCTVLTAAHHPHTCPPDVHACLAYPKSLSNTYSFLELRSSPSV
jgi:hypothetical protein